MSTLQKYYPYIVLACLLGFTSRGVHGGEAPVTPHELLPEQTIEIVGENVPQWKTIWDEARKSALKGDFDEAVNLYRSLLKTKNNLEEARWELARLLVYLKRWDEAAESLELLIGSQPGNVLYISSLGKVMWELERYERAVDLFKKVNLIDPGDQLALAGLVEGLMKLDRKKEALPYLEQLSRQEPANRGVRRYLAVLFYEEGNYEKARPHLTILSRTEEVEPDILYKTAKTYEHLGFEQQASVYWERFSARVPENNEAHLFLSRYYEKERQPDRALLHLQATLVNNPEDAESFARLAGAYEKTGDHGRARVYYEKYLEIFPEDRDVRRKMENITAATGRKKETLASLEQYYATESERKSADLRSIIFQYVAAGRYRDAVPLYKQLLELSPDNPDILESLANDLVVIGENEGRVAMLEYLSDIVPGNIAVYRSIAELLRKLERQEDLLAVLHKIIEIDPGDSAAVEDLAILYLEKEDLSASQEYFSMLADSDCGDIRCLQARAALSERLKMPEQELRDHEAVLKKQPNLYRTRFKAIDLAAGMGLLDTAVYHAGFLQSVPAVGENIELKILLADAYRKSGYFTRAVRRYRDIIARLSVQKDGEAEQFRIRSWLAIAESYKELGLLYEAEQTLRSALSAEKEHVPFLEALLQLSLHKEDVAQGEVWLQAINHEMDKLLPGNEDQSNSFWKRQLFRAMMLTASGDYKQSVKLSKRNLASLYRQKEEGKKPADSRFEIQPEFTVRTHIAENLIFAEKYAEAEEAINDLEEKYGTEPEVYVLKEQIFRAEGKYSAAEEAAAAVAAFAEKDFGRQLAVAKLYKKHGATRRYLASAESAARRKENSLAAQRFFVEALIDNGNYLAALDSLERLQKSYPDNSWLLARKAEISARVGRFQESLDTGAVILAENPARLDILLLKAQVLWEMNRWKESVELYNSALKPPVAEILAEKIREISNLSERGTTTASWWEAVSFSRGVQLDNPEVIMSPLHAVDFSETSQAVNSVSAPYYALYRWQQRFNMELSVRRSVMRGEYYHAANKLEEVIEEYGREDFLLYDLAGLYSRMDRLGDEAVLYQELEGQNPSLPDLAESAQRNSLKLRPHTYLSYVMQEDDGWDGYKAVKQEVMEAGAWYFQSTSQKWDLNVARIDYESTDDEQGFWAWRSMLRYDVKLFQALSLTLGGGIEDLGSGYSSTPLYYGAVTGEIADELRAVLSVRQDVTADTLASLKRNIERRDYKIELVLDILPRIVLEGRHDYIEYSDDNWTKNYSFLASYIFLPEPIMIKISYNYDFYDSKEGQKPGVPSDDGFAPDDHPYWSPEDYWIARFSFYLKRQLSNDALARGIPSYYTVEYSLGYDSNDNDLHELKGSLNIEILKKIILGASYAYVDLDVYQHNQASFTITYRW